jgi:CRISPR-associated protein Cas6
MLRNSLATAFSERSAMLVDLSFQLTSAQPIPADHGYALYAAVSRLLPAVHAENGFAIHPIGGRQVGERRMELMPWSTLSIRVPADQISSLLALAGKSLELHDATIRVGVPEVRPLIPATALRSRLVVIKVANVDARALTAERFAAAARRQLDDLGIAPAAQLTLGKRRSLGVHRKEIVGYELVVEGLTAEESITLQEKGLGGKRHMGCGVFVAMGEGAVS